MAPKNARSSAPASISWTPPIISGRRPRNDVARTRGPCTIPPPLASYAPNTIRRTRNNPAAAAHMAHGSNVTQRSHAGSRSCPKTRAASRKASISACADASRQVRMRLPHTDSTRPCASVTTAPTGTSSSAAAWRAASMAKCIACEPRGAGSKPCARGGGATVTAPPTRGGAVHSRQVAIPDAA
jgi:hypothetical protein